MASNGRDFLAVWSDLREGKSAVYTSRLTTDGQPFEPFGHRVAYASAARVSSAGDDYLIVWTNLDGSSAYSQRVDENGAPVGSAHDLPGGSTLALVSNGSTYLLAQRVNELKPGEATVLTVLDRDGLPLRSLTSSYDWPVTVGTHSGDYVVLEAPGKCASYVGCTYKPVLHELTESLATKSDVWFPQVDGRQSNLYLTAVVSPTGILLGWTGPPPDAKGYMLVDFEGRVLKLQTSLPTTIAMPSFGLSAAWDGRQFLLEFEANYNSIAGIRIAGDGSLIDMTQFLISSEPNGVDRLPFATNGLVQMTVWADRRFSGAVDIVARAVVGFDELAAKPNQAILVSQSGRTQIDLRLASAAGHVFSVWTNDIRNQLNGAIDGREFTISPPDADYSVYSPGAAAGKTSFLVIWIDPRTPANVLLKRIAFDGRVIDQQPVVLSTDSAPPLSWAGPDPTPSVAYDGRTFVVAWSNGDLFVARVPESGAAQSTSRIAVSTPLWAARSPRIMPTIDGLFVGFLSLGYNPVFDLGRPPTAVSAARLTNEGGAEFPKSPLFENINASTWQIVTAANEDHVLFVYPTYTDGRFWLFVVQTTIDGKPLVGPRPTVQLPPNVFGTPEIAWNGSEFVLAWTETPLTWPESQVGTIRAIRMDRNGEPIDLEPFVITSYPVAPFAPVLAPTTAGIAIGYSRYDADNGYAPRAFARTLDRLSPPPPRRRSMAH